MSHLMTTTTITIESLDTLPRAAAEFCNAMNGYTVFAFNGGMGAGKTTFINAVAQHLGVAADPTGSPTFAILNEYRCADGKPLYHFDLYRLESPEEVADTGFIDYVDSGNLCMVEWPDRAAGLFDPARTVEVNIDVDPLTDVRTLTLRYPS